MDSDWSLESDEGFDGEEADAGCAAHEDGGVGGGGIVDEGVGGEDLGGGDHGGIGIGDLVD